MYSNRMAGSSADLHIMSAQADFSYILLLESGTDDLELLPPPLGWILERAKYYTDLKQGMKNL
jgi:hypothetical protein